MIVAATVIPLISKSNSKHKYFSTKPRHKVEIIYQVLEIISRYAGEGIPRFHIQCRVEINAYQLTKYLSFLVDNRLLFVTLKGKSKRKPNYHVSQKGLIFMKLYSVDPIHREDLIYGISSLSTSSECQWKGAGLSNSESEERGD